MNRFKATDYEYHVSWSELSEGFVARCTEFPSLTNVDYDSLHNALAGMVELIQAVLDDMEHDEEVPPSPLSLREYSGRILLRMPPEQHRRIAIESAEQGVSINQLLVSRV